MPKPNEYVKMLLTNNTIESQVSSRFAETRFAEIRVRVRVRVYG